MQCCFKKTPYVYKSQMVTAYTGSVRTDNLADSCHRTRYRQDHSP